MPKTYQCENPACVLGTVGQPGSFSGGISKEQINLLTGRPLEELKSGEDFGSGFCPNCGQKGQEA
jgi:hypothetical protein